MPPHHLGSEPSRRRFLVGGAACAGALAVPSLNGAPRSAAATPYLLYVTNSSTEYVYLCLHQTPGGNGPSGVMPLAWLVRPSPPLPTPTPPFSWNVDYSFVWARTGVLTPGSTFTAMETVAADPGNPSASQIQFGADNGNPGFRAGPATGAPLLGSLYIKELSTVPADTASVGIGQSGSPVFAVQAQPDKTLRFTPGENQYWLAAGPADPFKPPPFLRGQVLDLEAITSHVEIPYDGTRVMQAVLNPGLTWTVDPGARRPGPVSARPRSLPTAHVR
ncbi:hypothetical protein ACFV3E_22745 [Streptomyces sp. NPDC059718]